MGKSFLRLGLLLSIVFLGTGCSKLLIYGMKKDPVAFMEALNETAKKAEEMKKKKEFEKQFSNPQMPEVDSKRAFQGDASSPITIVEYSDFQCSYCGRGYRTIRQLLDDPAYKGKIKFLYKHLPVTGAPMSRPAAEVFEALTMMDADKTKAYANAYSFHDKVFEDQGTLRKDGEAHMKKLLKEVLDSDDAVKKIMENAKSEEVQARLMADIKEAQKFEIRGTPAFNINGVFLKGAYPIEEFKKVIDRHLQAKK